MQDTAIQLLEASPVAASNPTDSVSGVTSTFGTSVSSCSLDAFDRAQYEFTGSSLDGGTLSVSCGAGYVSTTHLTKNEGAWFLFNSDFGH